MKIESGPELQIFFKCTLWIVNERPLGKTPRWGYRGLSGLSFKDPSDYCKFSLGALPT